jgi:hypothetical protein
MTIGVDKLINKPFLAPRATARVVSYFEEFGCSGKPFWVSQRREKKNIDLKEVSLLKNFLN